MSDTSKIDLSTVSTKDLSDELMKREGVEAEVVSPYQDHTVQVNGPAIVLLVYD